MADEKYNEIVVHDDAYSSTEHELPNGLEFSADNSDDVNNSSQGGKIVDDSDGTDVDDVDSSINLDNSGLADMEISEDEIQGGREISKESEDKNKSNNNLILIGLIVLIIFIMIKNNE